MSRSFLGSLSSAMQKENGRRQGERRGRLGQDVGLTGVCAAWRPCRCQHEENETPSRALPPLPHLLDMVPVANDHVGHVDAKVCMHEPHLTCT